MMPEMPPMTATGLDALAPRRIEKRPARPGGDPAGETAQVRPPAAFLQPAIEASVNGICIADATAPDQPILYVNPAFERLSGYSSAEIVGRNCRFLQASDRHQPEVATLHAAVRAGTSCQVVLRNYRKDGSMFWNELAVYPVRDAAGRLVAFIGVQNDVTERKELEQQIADTFRTIVSHASDIITFLDAEGNIRYESAAVAAVLGYGSDERVGTSFFAQIHAGDLAVAQAAFAQALQAVGGRLAFEARSRHRDGSWRYLEMMGTNLLHKPAVRTILVSSRDVTERKMFEEQLRHQALHDALTGLPNRALLQDRLHQAVTAAAEAGTSLALLLINLDHFRNINDTLGHRAGDHVLAEVAARLRARTRGADTVARLSGDEFAVLVPGAKEAGATWAARKILAAIAEPMDLAEGAVQSAASLGIAIFPEHGGDPTVLMRHADQAMHAAKRAGGGYAVYAEAQGQQIVDRVTLISELRRALADDALLLHYQPQVDLRSGRAVGVEALVRWPHPTRGLIPPDQFVALAEQMGATGQLTRWVLEAALAQHRAWQAAHLPLGVAVNLSMRSLHDPQLLRQIGSLLQKYEIARGTVTLEITESALMEDQAQLRRALDALGAMGVKLAIDDFGTGFSSLGQLSRLPVQELKIDKSLVLEMDTRPADAAIVRSIIEMGHSLGLTVVAEGVEKRSIWDLLARAGCDVAQGYFMGRPLPAAEFFRWALTSPFGTTRMAR